MLYWCVGPTGLVKWSRNTVFTLVEGSSVSTEAGFKLRPSFLKAPEIKSSPPTSTAEAESGRLVDKSIAIAGFSSSRGETAFSLGFGGVGDEVALNSRPGQVK